MFYTCLMTGYDSLFIYFCESTVNMHYSNGQQISVGNTKGSENSQTLAFSRAYRTYISIK